MLINTETHKWPRCRDGETAECLAINGAYISHPSSQVSDSWWKRALEERESQRQGITIRKQHLLDPAGECAELTVVNNSMHKTCARLNLPMEMGVGHAILPQRWRCWLCQLLEEEGLLWHSTWEPVDFSICRVLDLTSCVYHRGGHFLCLFLGLVVTQARKDMNSDILTHFFPQLHLHLPG